MEDITREYLQALGEDIAERRDDVLRARFEELHPADIAEIFDRLEADQVQYLWKQIELEERGDVQEGGLHLVGDQGVVEPALQHGEVGGRGVREPEGSDLAGLAQRRERPGDLIGVEQGVLAVEEEPAVASVTGSRTGLRAKQEEERRQALREEFVRLMRERFIRGEDGCVKASAEPAPSRGEGESARCPAQRREPRRSACAPPYSHCHTAVRRSDFFDYAVVDGDERYDDTEQQGRDAQERWFDDSDDEL